MFIPFVEQKEDSLKGINMVFNKKSKASFLAAIITLLINLVLFGLLSHEFTEKQSSILSNVQLDHLQIELEDISSEDLFITPPPGEDPLTDKKDKAPQSITKDKAPVKFPAQTTPPPAALPQNEEIQAEADPETVIEKIDVAPQALTVDSPKAIATDSGFIEDILKEPLFAQQKDENYLQKEREKYEFYQKNYKNIRNFRKVYPYALRTKEIIDSLNMKLGSMSNESERKRLIKDTEKRLFQQYEIAVRTMSTSQGKLLLKLIARETNKTGYEIIKDYKGAFPATFWYGVGKIFGTDLKAQFNKQKEDSVIEDIVGKYKNNDLY